jgi:hypothetical protein
VLSAVIGVLAVVLGGALPARAADDQAPLVVVGFSGVRWTDVSAATPALESMTSGAIGTVAVRSVFTAACPADGWLGLSAGRRATDFDGTSAEHVNATCAAVPEPVAGVQTQLAEYQRIADGDTFSAVPGTLGQALADAGTNTLAIGAGASLALAQEDGTVGNYVTSNGAAPDDGTLKGEKYVPAGAQPDVIGGYVQDALESGVEVIVVDAGTVRDADDLPSQETPSALSRADQVAQIDAVLAQVQRAIADSTGTDDTTLLAVSLADAGRTAHLQFGAATGPQPGGGAYDGYLGSRSTRQTAIVQTTDLTPTVLSLALGTDHGTTGLVGAPVSSTDPDASVADRELKVRDLDAAAQAVQPLVGPFFTVWGASQILLYAVATVALRKAWGGQKARHRILTGLRVVAVVFGAVCASTFLANTIPWWRFGDTTGSHLLAVTGAVALYVAVITAFALLGPWRRSPLGPLGFVGFTTAAVLAIDCATGSRLITSSLNGLQPVVAGRFYGLGNQQFALFATGSLLFTIALADWLVRSGRRKAAVAAVVVLGVVATYVDGVLGSDFGGPPAILPAFGFLALVVAGVRITWQRVVLILGATVLALAAISVVDWMRPTDDQTHLGRFVQTLIDGGAWQVVERKAAQNLRILYSNWMLSLVLALAAVFIGFVLTRPRVLGVAVLQRAYDRHPVLKPGLVCLVVLLGIGFAVNDSGAAVPAVGAMLAVPLIIACCTRVLEGQEEPAKTSA